MIFQSRVGHFKPCFLSSPQSKMDNLSAHYVENYLHISKLTQLLSVGQIQVPLGAKNKTGKFISPALYVLLTSLPYQYWELESTESSTFLLRSPIISLKSKPKILCIVSVTRAERDLGSDLCSKYLSGSHVTCQR